MNSSSRTRKEPSEPVTPGAAPPRASVKVKKDVTSTTMVLVRECELFLPVAAVIWDTDAGAEVNEATSLAPSADFPCANVALAEVVEAEELESVMDVAETEVTAFLPADLPRPREFPLTEVVDEAAPVVES
jgi:hypothetical protein